MRYLPLPAFLPVPSWWSLGRLFGLLTFVAVLLPGSGRSLAEDETPAVPERTAEAVAALKAAQWRQIEPGFSAITTDEAKGLSLAAFRFSTKAFVFSVAVQQTPTGERVDAYGEREGAVAAVNGGFFGEGEEDGELFSVGLLRQDGHDHSEAWTETGGFLVLSNAGVSIRPSWQGVPEGADNVIQSKPLLIEPGSKWAMNSNQEHLRKRSLVCLKPDGTVILFLVTRAGLSLYEAGWLMRGSQVGGFFGCDSALALDGGGSTQVWVAGQDELSFRGETPVHNALIVKRR